MLFTPHIVGETWLYIPSHRSLQIFNVCVCYNFGTSITYASRRTPTSNYSTRVKSIGGAALQRTTSSIINVQRQGIPSLSVDAEVDPSYFQNPDDDDRDLAIPGKLRYTLDARPADQFHQVTDLLWLNLLKVLTLSPTMRAWLVGRQALVSYQEARQAWLRDQK
jgi:hypothetical protein